MPNEKPPHEKLTAEQGWLSGKLLIATPNMEDPRFAHAVIYLCSHGPSGAMGLMLNKLYGELNFRALLGQLEMTMSVGAQDIPVHFGGPVEPGRGFVLHSNDYNREGTVNVSDGIALTATVEILQALADGVGPTRALLALGYAGWGAGQLDSELQTNGWLVAPADSEILFDANLDAKWEKALSRIGVSPMLLSGAAGHA